MNPTSKSHVRCFSTQLASLTMHGVELRGADERSAKDFVLVPGLGLSGHYMMPTARLLTAAGTVWVPDLPGCGRSEKPKPSLGIPELADALAEWMEICRIKNPVLIGNSLGAQVIVDFAIRYPERLDRAVLVSLTVDPAAPRAASQIWRLMLDALREPPRLYWIAIVDYLRAGLPGVLQTLRHAMADPVEAKLPQLSCPVLVIRGGRDPIVPQPWAERSAQLIEGGELVVFPPAAHAVNFNSPEALVNEVLKFARVKRKSDLNAEDRQAFPV